MPLRWPAIAQHVTANGRRYAEIIKEPRFANLGLRADQGNALGRYQIGKEKRHRLELHGAQFLHRGTALTIRHSWWTLPIRFLACPAGAHSADVALLASLVPALSGRARSFPCGRQ